MLLEIATDSPVVCLNADEDTFVTGKWRNEPCFPVIGSFFQTSTTSHYAACTGMRRARERMNERGKNPLISFVLQICTLSRNYGWNFRLCPSLDADYFHRVIQQKDSVEKCYKYIFHFYLRNFVTNLHIITCFKVSKHTDFSIKISLYVTQHFPIIVD